MNKVVDYILKKILRNKAKETSLRDTIEDLIEEDKISPSQSSIEDDELDMLFNLLQLRKIKVEEIMTCRSDIVAISVSSSIDELFAKFIAYKKNSILVYQKNIDNILGIVYLKDILHLYKSHDSNAGISQYISNVLFIPPSMINLNLLLTMKHENIDKAVVVNEYGSVDGVVSLKDIMDEIIGDIEEMNKINDSNSKISHNVDGSITIDASATIKDLEKISGIKIKTKREDVETIGGLVLLIAGKIPNIGDIININDTDVQIIDANARQIKKIKITRRSVN